MVIVKFEKNFIIHRGEPNILMALHVSDILYTRVRLAEKMKKTYMRRPGRIKSRGSTRDTREMFLSLQRLATEPEVEDDVTYIPGRTGDPEELQDTVYGTLEDDCLSTDDESQDSFPSA